MINPTRILLVEGADDLHVISSLLQHHGIPEIFEIQQKGGIDRILELLPVQLKASGIETVGIVVDADVEIANRWTAIRAIFERDGFVNVPTEPDEAGTV